MPQETDELEEIEHSFTLTSILDAQLVQSVGTDRMVVQAARVSTVGAPSEEILVDDFLRLSDKDVGLIKFLMRESHLSPFEHSAFTFLLDVPIFVAREFMRHRTFSFSETSGRYRQLEPKFYVPSIARPMTQVGKPGAYEFVHGEDNHLAEVVHAMSETVRLSYGQYQSLLDLGVAREVARNVLPVGIYTQFYATCNARNLMRFLALRTKSPDAAVPSYPLYEIEVVANQMEDHFAAQMPVTYGAWVEFGRKQT